jgi:hypothetical protein
MTKANGEGEGDGDRDQAREGPENQAIDKQCLRTLRVVDDQLSRLVPSVSWKATGVGAWIRIPILRSRGNLSFRSFADFANLIFHSTKCCSSSFCEIVLCSEDVDDVRMQISQKEQWIGPETVPIRPPPHRESKE